jgi:micrococcal nuclease
MSLTPIIKTMKWDRKPAGRCYLLIASFITAVLLFPFGLERAAGAEDLRNARVIKVHDGDTVTIRMDGKRYRTRLVGMDAPEMGQEPWGRRAKDHLQELVKESGGNVLVETDITRYDKYDRLLAYLWLDSKRMVNELMVKDGYAVLFTIQPNSRYADRFIKAQRYARENKMNIWGPKGLTERPIEYKKKHPRQ